MKLAVMAYHANAEAMYDRGWIAQCVESMGNQTDTDFDVYETNYGGGTNFYFPHSVRVTKALPSFVDAMNFMLTNLLTLSDYDAVLNVNIDDYYAPERVAQQRAALEDGADIVSSNFRGVGVNGEMWPVTEFDKLNIIDELAHGHNIIAHGVVAYSRKFWNTCSRYDPDEVPYEDLLLWQREIRRQKFVVLSDALMTYRNHPRSVSNQL